MKILSCFFSVVLSVLIYPVNATPWGMPGDAIIRSDNGKPSICMPENSHGSVSMSSISVSESHLHDGVRLTMWRIELEPDGSPMLLKPGDCVFYGVKPSGYQQSVAAKPLKVGDTYYARINITVANPSRQSTLFYDAVFCVAGQRDGSFTYPQYQYEQSGKTIKPACGKRPGDVSSH
jgi:hypothetical protein